MPGLLLCRACDDGITLSDTISEEEQQPLCPLCHGYIPLCINHWVEMFAFEDPPISFAELVYNLPEHHFHEGWN